MRNRRIPLRFELEYRMDKSLEWEPLPATLGVSAHSLDIISSFLIISGTPPCFKTSPCARTIGFICSAVWSTNDLQ